MASPKRDGADPLVAALERIADGIDRLADILEGTGVPSRPGREEAVWRDRQEECGSLDPTKTEVEDENRGSSSWSMQEAKSFLDAMKQKERPCK
jgi:hypothetical protein